MKKASSSFLLLAFAALFLSVNSFAQVRERRPVPQPQPIPQIPSSQSQIISEQVNQSIRAYQRLRVAELLRLMRHEEASTEVVSLRIVAESLIQGPAQLELQGRGRVLATEKVKRQMHEIALLVPAGSTAESLELSASADIHIASITAEVRSQRIPGPGQPIPGQLMQVSPNSLVTLKVHQAVRGYAQISLDQIVRSQLGLTLEGASIERVVIQGQPVSYGRAASVQLELNHRPVGEVKYLTNAQGQTPIRVQTLEEVRALSLIVSGDAQISEIRIRVGQVRPRYTEVPRAERVFVGRHIDLRMPLHLIDVLRYESRLIRAIRIEGRATRQMQAHLTLVGAYSELQGAGALGSHPSSALIVLRRPMMASELRIETQAAVLIDSLEIEFETYRY